MLFRYIKFTLIVICLISLETSAFSAFKTGRIGNAKNLVSTPIVDLIAAFAASLNDPNSILTSKTLEDIHLNVDSFGGFPLSAHSLRFIKQSLIGVDIGTSHSSFQNAFNVRLSDNATACPAGNCDRAAADWMHEQISEDNTSEYFGQWSLVTANLLDDLIDIDGYTNSVLSANNASITTLQSDAYFRSIANIIGAGTYPDPATIKNRINDAGGFVNAISGGSSSSSTDYSIVQNVVDAYRNNDDRANFTATTFTNCYQNSETTRSGGVNTCSVSSDFWSTQQTLLTNFETLKGLLSDNTTLSIAQLEGIGIDLSSLPVPAESWHLDYLSSALDQNATLISSWQSTITQFSTQTAALWKIGQVAMGASGHPSSDLTPAIINTAIGSNFDSSTLMTARSSASASNFAGDTNFTNLTPPNNTASNVKSELLSYVGFTDAQYTAWNNNSDKTSFTASSFNACFASSDTLTGNANACSISLNDWNAINTLVTAVNDNQTLTITEAAINDLYGVDNSTYSINLGDGVNMAYVQDCLFALNPAHSGNIKTCINNATGQEAAKWKIYQISLGQDNTTHPLTDLTTGLYDRAVNSSSGFLQNLFDANPNYSLTNLQGALRSYFTNNSITDESSDDAFKLFPVSRVGFRDSLTSYNSWIASTGFSVSAVDNSSENIVRVWEACRRSLDTLSGGSATCNPTYAQWKTNAENRAANNIIQTRGNDAFWGRTDGPRVYTETLMGIVINLHDVSVRDSTQWQWTDQNGNSQTSTHGWASSNGSYAFWSTSLANSPPIGSLLTRQ